MTNHAFGGFEVMEKDNEFRPRFLMSWTTSSAASSTRISFLI